ncbi:hypothetical protein Ancab_007136 [Ancistrocladus abbreviatus]
MNTSSSHAAASIAEKRSMFPPLPPSPNERQLKAVRIYVGGLGEAVAAEDLRKTFSNLGAVESVEILRTKGRSFAYINFLPSSDKSLPKLFSTYNGCLWKGGRLRLEKAKEHYLDRLRREWAEDAEILNEGHDNSAVVHKDMDSSTKDVRAVGTENMQIRMFFPRMRKVKLLPFKGTGKHKYSFQRVESTSLPLYFCDCPVHSDHSQMADEKQVDMSNIQSGGMNEEEINMMQSIMTKLFEREHDSKTVCNGPQASPQGVVETLDDLPVDDSVLDNETDDDNLILNLVSTRNSGASLPKSGKQHSGLVTEGKMSGKPQISEAVLAEERLGFWKGNSTPTDKKRKSIETERYKKELVSPTQNGNRKLQTLSEHSEEQMKSLNFLTTKQESDAKQFTENGSGLRKAAWRGFNNSFNLLEIIAGGISNNEEKPESGHASLSHSNKMSLTEVGEHEKLDGESSQLKEQDMLSEAQLVGSYPSSDKSARGTSWLQKSSWTQLLGDANSNSFRISQILPGMNFEKLDLQNPNAINSNHSACVKQQITEADHQILDPCKGKMQIAAQSSDLAFSKKKKQSFSQLGVQKHDQEHEQDKDSRDEKLSVSTSGQKSNLRPMQTSNAILQTSESCPFMRNAASVREWATAKAAISGSRKKKNKQPPGDW